jgi:prepilin-type N-terminal cleavage/methylation domain-containing protein
MKRRTNRGGFSLIELLVVIAIIGILVAMSMAAIQRARASAAQIECANNLKQIGLALQMHVNDFGMLPSNGGWDGKQTILNQSGQPFTPYTIDTTQSAHQVLLGSRRSGEAARAADRVLALLDLAFCGPGGDP